MIEDRLVTSELFAVPQTYIPDVVENNQYCALICTIPLF
jgi:hypothetical protein